MKKKFWIISCMEPNNSDFARLFAGFIHYQTAKAAKNAAKEANQEVDFRFRAYKVTLEIVNA